LVASARKAAYVAAKHGVVGMAKVAAIELANADVTVNAICPGWVLTPLVEKQLEDRTHQEGTGVEHEKFQFLTEKRAMAQFSTAEEIGALTAFLSTDDAKTITGAPIPIDGGWVAHQGLSISIRSSPYRLTRYGGNVASNVRSSPRKSLTTFEVTSNTIVARSGIL
jgi:NAD(P)-dependent dehydrogenase (short-subunit alcohol dehydrogenase family)